MVEEEAKVVPTTYDATNQTDILPTAGQTSQTAAPTYRDAAVQATPEPTLEHTHCVRGAQTPAALRPLPIAKLKVGDESGWYLSKSKNADGSRVIHFSDSRFHETRECSSGMAGRERVLARPCRCCLIPMFLVDTPHVDSHGVYRADIDDPELLVPNRAYICGR